MSEPSTVTVVDPNLPSLFCASLNSYEPSHFCSSEKADRQKICEGCSILDSQQLQGRQQEWNKKILKYDSGHVSAKNKKLTADTRTTRYGLGKFSWVILILAGLRSYTQPKDTKNVKIDKATNLGVGHEKIRFEAGVQRIQVFAKNLGMLRRN